MKSIVKIISLSLVFSLILTTFSWSQTSAESNLTYTEEDVEELANVLEVLFDTGVVYDYDGNIIGFDEEIIEREILDTQYSFLVDDIKELGLIVDNPPNNKTELTENYTNYNQVVPFKTKRDAFIDQCILDKLNDSYGIAAATAIITAIKNKQWTNAAKRLIKLGIKSAPTVIIANLGWILGSCIYAADKKGL